MPDTVCVEERLPPGAAAVLINRTHTYTDLYLPVDAREKSLFDAIDGERTIGEIAREQATPDTARAFFERLWWYDQVVFDASRPRACPADARRPRPGGSPGRPGGLSPHSGRPPGWSSASSHAWAASRAWLAAAPHWGCSTKTLSRPISGAGPCAPAASTGPR